MMAVAVKKQKIACVHASTRRIWKISKVYVSPSKRQGLTLTLNSPNFFSSVCIISIHTISYFFYQVKPSNVVRQLPVFTQADLRQLRNQSEPMLYDQKFINTNTYLVNSKLSTGFKKIIHIFLTFWHCEFGLQNKKQ